MGLSFDIVMGFQCSSGNAHLLNSVYPVIRKNLHTRTERTLFGRKDRAVGPTGDRRSRSRVRVANIESKAVGPCPTDHSPTTKTSQMIAGRMQKRAHSRTGDHHG